MNATILIVDDDPDGLTMLADFVRAMGSMPVLAADGTQALERLRNLQPDLILLDAVMPGLDGFETCRRIKADPMHAGVPVIFMTGLSDTDNVVMGLEAGGVDYVTKPLELSELGARIRVHLANAQRTRSAMTGLESVGARLFTCDGDGTVRWSTPQAQALLDGMSAEAASALHAHLNERPSDASTTVGPQAERYIITHLGSAGADETLYRIVRSNEGSEADVLRVHFALTPREADVLLWTARGKSNKDMSDILNISARTVNKHLEQIFIKIGVENRASAAAVATRALLTP